MKLRNIFIAFLLFLTSTCAVFADKTASIDYCVEVPRYLQITTVTSPVLIANITDSTGNLYAPLLSKFKVVSNSEETQTLYLKAETRTENGIEESMFMMHGRVYIAFANLQNIPKGYALANCKMGTHPKESPGIVAYPVTSILGAKSKYNIGKNKYEVFVENGTTDIIVNVGSNVLKNSFAANDPKGFYQATLSLTESDI